MLDSVAQNEREAPKRRHKGCTKKCSQPRNIFGPEKTSALFIFFKMKKSILATRKWEFVTKYCGNFFREKKPRLFAC
jgi:hypothetical protein